MLTLKRVLQNFHFCLHDNFYLKAYFCIAEVSVKVYIIPITRKLHVGTWMPSISACLKFAHPRKGITARREITNDFGLNEQNIKVQLPKNKLSGQQIKWTTY